MRDPRTGTEAIATETGNDPGVSLGVLTLDTRFPRIPGDVGNAATWPFPTLYRVISDAFPDELVRHPNRNEWLERFVSSARELEDAGVDLITTSCGFLVLFQNELQQRLRIPILTSSLLQVPWVASLLPPGRTVGILTIDRASLTPAHLTAAGITHDAPIVIQGMGDVGGYFAHQILENEPDLDVERCVIEHERAARLLRERNPEVRAIVLECTNMPPYASRIRAAAGVPVYDITTFVQWFLSVDVQRPFND